MKGHFYWWQSLIDLLIVAKLGLVVCLFDWLLLKDIVRSQHVSWYYLHKCINHESKQTINSSQYFVILFFWLDWESICFIADNFTPYKHKQVCNYFCGWRGQCWGFFVFYMNVHCGLHGQKQLLQYTLMLTHTHTHKQIERYLWKKFKDSEAEMNPVSQQTLMEERCRVPQRSSPDC